MKKFLLFILLFQIVQFVTNAQIQSGPMVGYSEMKEVMLWVQTQKPSKVKFVYWDKENPAIKYSTAEITTNKHDGNVAKLVCDQVTMGKKYDYEVWVNGKKVARDYPLSFQSQELWQYRKDPANFKFAFGSCNYINEAETDRPGRAYGGYPEIFTSIYQKQPDFMMWGGDNFYYREPDWNTRTGMIHRNTHSRSIPEIQPLLGSVHHYAIWDDHDYGPNDADRSFWNKNMSLEMFKLFWANPNYVFENEATTGTFQWNDVQFFMVDNRWFRTPNDNHTGDRDFLGKKQINWLIDALIGSKATFKFIVCGGQVINPAKVFENMATYDAERAELLKKIADAKVPGVFFLTGDRHHTCLQKLERAGNLYPLYDLTISPLTSGPSKPVKDENNSPIVDGTLYTERNFAICEVAGPLKDRVLKITVYDTKGTQVWVKDIHANELK
ncbi:alkaline phosphatase D family protein [Flectobacillus roseus]|uniref:Alkaline phosphatase D family protein n=1 Tax=Flectobacillus roseus TaxID=502259 RepID=A0ABT6Y7S8_9BACT|nr:alkaline phosphatase D family protein [Flectobacillus roseus]MDI9859168.1 alkaline phosphatase D family protein [Flectobacillus roseus]